MMSRYTVEPGRAIYKNGSPFIIIRRAYGTSSTEANNVTHEICSLLNQYACSTCGGTGWITAVHAGEVVRDGCTACLPTIEGEEG